MQTASKALRNGHDGIKGYRLTFANLQSIITDMPQIYPRKFRIIFLEDDLS